MTKYQGIVKGNIVLLPEGVQLEEGAKVEVRLLPSEYRDSEQSAEETFKQELVRIGLLKRIRRPAGYRLNGDRTPIEIEGTLSKAIIEDRR
jgi:hypothetical protein